MRAADAAVGAMAGATLCVYGDGEGCHDHWVGGPLKHPECALAALAASPEVRAALVAAVTAAEGWYDPAGAYTGEGEPIPGIRTWPLVDAVLAALTPGGAGGDDGGAT